MNTTLRAVLLVVVVGLIAYFVFGRSSNAPIGTVPPQPNATVAFSCDGGKGIIAAFYTGTPKAAVAGQPPVPTGSVALQLSDGRKMTLAQTISADGARYANANESFVFWGKGNGALVLEGGAEKDFKGCIVVSPIATGVSLPAVYSNSTAGFSIRLTSGFTVDEKYRYTLNGPGKDIAGIKFTIPASVASGTNLSADTYLSFEELHVATTSAAGCVANLFLNHSTSLLATDGRMTYSVATSTGAGAGNRYTEAVFAIPGTAPCVAVRYYIHSTVFENYPTGKVTRFDEAALLATFDAIRRTLILKQ